MSTTLTTYEQYRHAPIGTIATLNGTNYTNHGHDWYPTTGGTPYGHDDMADTGTATIKQWGH